MNGFDPSRLIAPAVVIMLLVLVFSGRATKGNAKETAEGIAFAIKPAYTWARMLLLPAYMGFFLWIAWRKTHTMPVPVILIFLIFVAISLIQLPGTILLTPTAVIQRYWFQPAKTILYTEVMTIQSLQAGRSLLVLGDNRVRIRHSDNHSAREEFRTELERRTGKRALT